MTDTYDARSEAFTISFDLTTRVAVGNRLAVFLHLFREEVCFLTKRISIVDEREAVLVLAKCSDSLERRGYHRFVDGAFAPRYATQRAA